MRIDLRDALADLAAEAAPVDLRGEVLRRSRRLAVRRAVATALVAVAGLGGLTAMVLPRAQHTPPPPGTSHSATPTPDASPTASGADSRLVDIRSSTLDIPRFPGFESACPAGRWRFSGGRARIREVPGSGYLFQIQPVPLIFADLDGEPGPEVLVTVRCTGPGTINPYQLLAIKAMPDGSLRTLGSVVRDASGTFLDYDYDDVHTDGRTVLVEVMGRHRPDGVYGVKQPRGYAFVDGSFRQVSGETAVAPAPTDIRQLDPRNATLRLIGFDPCVQQCWSVTVRFTDGAGTDTTDIDPTDGVASLVTYTYLVEQTSFVTGADGRTKQLVTVSRGDGNGNVSQAVFAIGSRPAPLAPAGGVVLRSSTDGSTSIINQHGSGRLAVITVRTASGEEQRTYSESPDGQTWARVS